MLRRVRNVLWYVDLTEQGEIECVAIEISPSQTSGEKRPDTIKVADVLSRQLTYTLTVPPRMVAVSTILVSREDVERALDELVEAEAEAAPK